MEGMQVKPARKGKTLAALERPKIVEKIVPKELVEYWHQVLHRPSQVQRSLPCHPVEVVVGLRLAMLFPHGEFLGPIPEEKFYTGTVSRVHNDMMTIDFDGNPYGINITCGIKYYSLFCIPIPKGAEAATAIAAHAASKKRKGTK